MNSIYKILIALGTIALMFQSCEDEYGPRKESTPIFESAAANPTTFTFGDSITLTAKISDPATRLTALYYEIISGEKVITSGVIPLDEKIADISEAIYIPLMSNQSDNSEITINLTAKNILKGTATHKVSGITGKRPAYNLLYLVTEDGAVAQLKSQPGNKYKGENLTLDTSFRFRIAEKLHTDNSIDYSGDVYGNVNGKIEMIDQAGESAFAFTPNVDYTKEFIFDNLEFKITASGSKLGADDLSLSAFGDTDIANESFRTLKRTFEKGKTYSVFGRLADSQNIYNPDFFERVASDKVKFIRESGEYTIYYNGVRKNIIVGVENPSYPNYLLACGWGLGYPTKVTSKAIASVYNGRERTHTDWGFDNILKYVLLPRISEGVYQGTFYTPGDESHYAGFKPFENTGWGNEKKAGQFTFTGEKIIKGDDNWEIPNGENDPVIESANYRFTIDLINKKVHIEKIIL